MHAVYRHSGNISKLGAIFFCVSIRLLFQAGGILFWIQITLILLVPGFLGLILGKLAMIGKIRSIGFYSNHL
ncbi:MAG: hypothetical protein CMI18_06380 [Opitutaceae bacterium]|nr:hypothetical protein [Opitutaceae bacterium]